MIIVWVVGVASGGREVVGRVVVVGVIVMLAKV